MLARRAAATLALAAGLASVALTAPPASADDAGFTDRSADVWRRTFDSQGQPTGWEREPERSLEDAESVEVDHGPRRLVLTVHMLDLRSESFLLGTASTLRLDDGRRFSVYTSNRGGASLYDRDADESVECEGVRARYDIDAETIRAVVPRTCLGDPAWVRVSTVVDGSPDGATFFQDAVGVFGPTKPRITRRVAVG